MNKLQHYSSNNNLKEFINTFRVLMETPHREDSREQLRHLLSSTLPFFIFDPVHSELHSELVDAIQDNIRIGNLNLSAIHRGTVDIQNFFQTVANTSNTQAFDALYPLVEVIQTHNPISQTQSLAQAMRDQLARQQHQRIAQEIDGDGHKHSKRKM